MVEIRREFEKFVSKRPATREEVDRIKLNPTRSLPGTFATNRSFLGSIVESNRLGLPFDYAAGAAGHIAAVTLDGVRARARSAADPDRLAWIVVGDLGQFEESVRALNDGEVEVRNAFGHELR